jgi:hypothetical protein
VHTLCICTLKESKETLGKRLERLNEFEKEKSTIGLQRRRSLRRSARNWRCDETNGNAQKQAANIIVQAP